MRRGRLPEGVACGGSRPPPSTMPSSMASPPTIGTSPKCVLRPPGSIDEVDRNGDRPQREYGEQRQRETSRGRQEQLQHVLPFPNLAQTPCAVRSIPEGSGAGTGVACLRQVGSFDSGRPVAQNLAIL